MIIFERQMTGKETVVRLDNRTNLLKVQMFGKGEVIVQGTLVEKYTDFNDFEFHNLTGINDSNFVLTNPISQPGIYTFDTTGLTAVKIIKSAEDLVVQIAGVE